MDKRILLKNFYIWLNKRAVNDSLFHFCKLLQKNDKL